MLTEAEFSADDQLQVLNADGSIWANIPLNSYRVPEEAYLFAYNADYYVFVLQCSRITEQYYEVIVNELKQEKKYIARNNPYVEYQPWKQHLLELFAVDFDPENNPLRVAASGNAETVIVDDDATLQPVKVRGDYLQVQDEELGITGWVRWRVGDRLVIETFYLC